MAKSVFGSSRIKFAINLFPFIFFILIDFAFLITCDAVKIWPNEDITIPIPSGAVPGGSPNHGYLKPGHVGKTDTTDGETLSQAVIRFEYEILEK